MLNRWKTPHDPRSSALASLRISTLAVALAAGVTNAPLHAQPGPCEAPTVTIRTSPELAVTEGGGATVAFDVEVDVGGAEYCFWEVTYQTGGGDATPGEDYLPIDPTTECRSGNDTVRATVELLANAASESAESFEIQVPSIVVGGCTDGDRFEVDERAVVTLGDYRPTKVSIDDVKIEEADADSTNAVFTVRAESPSGEPIAVRFHTEDGDAKVSDGDYKAQFGSLTIAPVEPYQATISVPVVGDTGDEDDETFSVLLTGADGAAIVDGEGTGTILDDDEAAEEKDAEQDVEQQAASPEAGDATSTTDPADATEDPEP